MQNDMKSKFALDKEIGIGILISQIAFFGAVNVHYREHTLQARETRGIYPYFFRFRKEGCYGKREGRTFNR
jgi:hypothetical protein